MKSIGILTTYFASNYGAALQPFALKRTLENLGYEVEMLPYRQQYIYEHYSPFIMRKYLSRNLMMDLYNLRYSYYTIRKELAFRKYIRKHITEKPLSDNVSRDKDFYFIGSDQLWRTFGDSGFDPVYCGYFDTKKGAKKIAYAVSGDYLEFNDVNKAYLKSAFNNFDFLSVREKQRADQFMAFSERKDFEVVCDPTILADANIYKEIDHIDPLPNKQYVLFYYIRQSLPFVDKVIKFARDKGLEVAIFSEGFNSQLLRLDKYNPDIHYLADAGEEQFLGAIKFSQYVFTPSFHGNVFATLYHKNLFTLVLDDGKDNRAMELMDVAGIKGRLLRINDEIIETFIDWQQVDANLAKYREHSMNYVKRALSI